MMNSGTKLLLLSLCSLLLALASSACASRPATDGNAGGNSAPVSQGTSAAEGGGGGGSRAALISADDKPLDVMTRAVRAQLDAKSYRAHVVASLGDDAPTKMVIEYVAPDRYRMVRDVKGQGAGESSQMEFIVVGDEMYFRAPNGRWARSPVAGNMIKSFHNPKMIEELAKTADVKFVGPDTLGGAPMYVYQYTQNNPLGMNVKSTSKTWLSVADGMPRQTETEGVYDGKKARTVVTLSDYNADIKIESPVKED